MKSLLLACTCLLSPLSISAMEISTSALNQLESTTAQLAPSLRASTLMISREGISTIYPGVAVSSNGHILTSFIPDLGKSGMQYFLIHNNQRVQLETLVEDRITGAALLQVREPELRQSLTAVPLPHPESPALTAGDWKFTTAFNPSPTANDTVRVHQALVLRAGESDIDRFTLSATLKSPGSPVFDADGCLRGLITKARSDSYIVSCVPITSLYEEWDSLAALAPKTPRKSSKPINANFALSDSDIKGTSFRSALTQHFTEAYQKKVPQPSIVTILEDGNPVIYGTVISAEGLILTKASEVGSNLTCSIDGQIYPATLLATDPETDLALLSVKANKLTPVTWRATELQTGDQLYAPIASESHASELPSLGSYLHSGSAARSHHSLHSPENVTSLGVVLEHSTSNCKIAALLPDATAEKAQFRRGETITAINGKATPNRQALRSILATFGTGDEVTVTLEHDAKTREVKLKLDGYKPVPSPRGMDARKILTYPSVRAYGFPQAIHHDAPLESWQCGGPLYNSQWQVVGINIARHSRGLTYALPPRVIRASIQRMLSSSDAF